MNTNTHERERLDSWKEIAAHLNRQVRTVQRWEKSEGLPIHRHVHGSRGTVFALRSELDEWLERRTESTLPSPEPVASTRTGRRLGLLFVPAALALLAVGWITTGGESVVASAPVDGPIRLAVLPFDSLGAEPLAEPVTTGFLEELITQMSRVDSERVAVIGRTSSIRFGNSGLSLSEIRRELGVDFVLEGSLRVAGDDLRVTARLVHAELRDQLWAGTFDIDVQDLFRAEVRVAQRVAEAVAEALLATRVAVATPASVDPIAHEAWLTGRYLWHEGTRRGFLESREHFEAALEIDPDFVAAHVGLAHAHNLLGRYGHLPPKETFPRARAEAQLALDLDPNAAEAHAALALTRFYYDWDFPGAATSFQRAIQLAPESGLVHHWYAHFLSAMGLHDLAIHEVSVARALEPMWPLVSSDAAWFYFRARRFEEAIEASRHALILEPAHGSAASCLVGSLRRLDRGGEAWPELRRLLAGGGLFEENPGLAKADAEAGFAAYWEWVRAENEDGSERTYVPPFSRVFSLDAAAEPEAVMDWLEEAVRVRDRAPLLMRVHPHFDPLRDDRRFMELVESVGFPADASELID